MKKLFVTSVMTLALMATVNGQTKQTLSLDGSEGRLYAELQMPANENDTPADKTPLVIICHGFTGNANETLLVDIADDLQAKGIASLRFDFNGHGKSEGEFQNMTVPNEIDDLKNVIVWAQSQPWVENISLVGHSQGGVVVSMTAGELGDSIIKSVVLMAPAAALRDDALRGNTMGKQYDPFNMQEDYIELWGGLKLGRKYIETAAKLPIYETAWKYTGPVLVVHGLLDRVVPYTYSERYDQVYKNSTLKMYSDEDHSLNLERGKVAQFVADWFATQLK